MIEIYNYKINVESTMKAPISAADVAGLYRGKQSSVSEPVTDRFVDDALTIVSRAFIPYPEVRRTIEQCDEDFFNDGPFNKISKLLTCVQKAGSSEMITWVILAAVDSFRAGSIDMGDGQAAAYSVRSLAGEKGKPGFVQLFTFKHEFKVFFWQIVAQQVHINERSGDFQPSAGESQHLSPKGATL